MRWTMGRMPAMAMVMAAAAAAAMAMAVAPAVSAQMPSAPCAPPSGLAGWAHRHPVGAAARIGGSPVPELHLGDAVDLGLVPIAVLSVAAPLGKPPQESDHGGLVTFRATMSGTYRIALGSRAWIDVAQGGTPLASIGHAMGPACAGIAKQVDFALAPGVYTIQLSAAADAVAPIEIVRLP